MPGESTPATPHDPQDHPDFTSSETTPDPLPSLPELYRRRDELGSEIDNHLKRLGRA